MRTPTTASIAYSPGVVPENAAEMRRFLFEELNKVSACFQLLAAGQIDMTYAAPAKPREGMVRLADGTSWNPGSGKGFYGYYGAAWHLLG